MVQFIAVDPLTRTTKCKVCQLAKGTCSFSIIREKAKSAMKGKGALRFAWNFHQEMFRRKALDLAVESKPAPLPPSEPDQVSNQVSRKRPRSDSATSHPSEEEDDEEGEALVIVGAQEGLEAEMEEFVESCPFAGASEDDECDATQEVDIPQEGPRTRAKVSSVFTE